MILYTSRCERIFKTPIPTVYTGHTSRFVGVWLALLPLAVWDIDPSWNHLLTIPSCALITFFLIGVEIFINTPLFQEVKPAILKMMD